MDTVFLDEQSMIFENSFSREVGQFDTKFMSFMENCSELTYVTEKEHEDIIVVLRRFWAALVSTITNFVKTVINESKKSIREFESKRNLHATHDKVSKLDPKAYSVVTDIWEVCNIYNEAVAKTHKLSKKIIANKYRYLNELNNDIAEFNSLVDKYDAELERAINKKVKVKNEVLQKFLEDEITGRSRVYKNIEMATNKFEDIQKDIAKISIEADILGADMLGKKISFFKNIGIKFSKFIKKWTSKIVSVVVFFGSVL